MAVIDLWYLRRRGPDGKRVKSKRHGRGMRYRVEYVDAAGVETSRSFAKLRPAEDFDAACRAGTAPEVRVDQAATRQTFREYVERWHAAREFTWEIETRRRIPGNLTHHLYPQFGDDPIGALTLTDVLEWISHRLATGTPKSSMKLYYELFNTVMRSAETDRVIEVNPCKGIKLSSVFRGLSSAPRWVPTEAQVLDLFAVVPERFHAAIWLGAGAACRIGEVLGMEDSDRCFGFDERELHVVQQLQYDMEAYGGFFLKEPKGGSGGTVELDDFVAQVLGEHLRAYPATEVDLVDVTSGEPVARTANLLFTDDRGRPFHEGRWSEHWTKWRKAAGWPVIGGTFHALRHFCATIMLSNHADPQQVQKLLRHSSLQITLSIYVHWLPRDARPKNVVSTVLRAAAQGRAPQSSATRIGAGSYPILTG